MSSTDHSASGADATAANAALDPERLHGIEAGVDWRPSSGTRLSATVFANRLKDAIANVTLGAGPGVFPGVGFVAAGGAFRQRQNIDATETHGLEIDGEYLRGPWRASFSYALSDARVEASGVASPLDGLRPAQIPKHQASASLDWTHGAVGLGATARFTSAQNEDDLGERRLPSALTFDTRARLVVPKLGDIELRVENLFDRRVIAAVSGDGIRERALPRTIWIGLQGPLGQSGVGPHGERPHASDLGRHRRKAKADVGKLIQPGQMLADRNVRAEQQAVDRPRPCSRIVDIVAVDPDERRPALDQRSRGGFGQEWMVVEISVGPPIAVPAGVNQHGLCPNVQTGERVRIDRQPIFERPPDDQPFKVGQRFQRQLGQILAIGVAMERAVDIGAGVGDHVDPADLERSSRRRNAAADSSRVQKSHMMRAGQALDRSSCPPRSHG